MATITGFWQAKLPDMIEAIGEDETRKILSTFSCPLNPDIEDFIKNKAIMFAQQGYAATHLIFASYQGKPVLVGYYALANKTVTIKGRDLSSKWRSRLSKFANYYADVKQYVIALPLIGQLGKNFTNGYDALITGDELLQMACDKIRDMQLNVGGKMAYLECEDTPALIEFYTRNGFQRFANRNLDGDELHSEGSKYLVQMLIYFSQKNK